MNEVCSYDNLKNVCGIIQSIVGLFYFICHYILFYENVLVCECLITSLFLELAKFS